MTGRRTASRTSSSAPSDEVRPPRASAAFSSRRPAPPDCAASASSTEATATSIIADMGSPRSAIGRLAPADHEYGRVDCQATPRQEKRVGPGREAPDRATNQTSCDLLLGQVQVRVADLVVLVEIGG